MIAWGTDRFTRARSAACAAAIAAAVPYAVLKVVWLAGGSVGSATAAGAADLHDLRHTAGNLVTLAMELCAVLLALALTHPRGRKLPAAILLVPVWAGTGLLAPIALGLPVGVVVQAIAGGSPAPAHNGLHGWVYGVVYSGFTVQAAALSTAFLLHVRLRWAHLLALPLPALGGTGTRVRALAGAGAAATGVYAAANLAWAVASEPAAPAGFETIAQRSLLVSDGLLGLAGTAGVLLLVHGAGRGRLWAALAIGWAGSASTVASGIAGYALAASRPEIPTSLLLALGSAGGLLLAAAGLLVLDRGPFSRRGARAPARSRGPRSPR